MSNQVLATIQDVLAGDLDRYRDLIRLFERDVHRFAASYFATRAAVEDVTQDVFIAAYEHLDRYDQSSPFRAWLLGIARNVVRQELRRQYRTEARLELYSKYLDAAQSVPQSTPQPDLADALAKCRNELTATAQDAIRKRYEEGKSIEEIARNLERTIVATRQLLYRTRIALRDCIRQQIGVIGGES